MTVDSCEQSVFWSSLYVTCSLFLEDLRQSISRCNGDAAVFWMTLHCKNDGGYFPPKLCPTIGGRSHHSNCGGLLTPNSVHHRWEIPPE